MADLTEKLEETIAERLNKAHAEIKRLEADKQAFIEMARVIRDTLLEKNAEVERLTEQLQVVEEGDELAGEEIKRLKLELDVKKYGLEEERKLRAKIEKLNEWAAKQILNLQGHKHLLIPWEDEPPEPDDKRPEKSAQSK